MVSYTVYCTSRYLIFSGDKARDFKIQMFQRDFLHKNPCLSLECVNVNIIFQIIGRTPAGTLNNMNLNIKQLQLNIEADQQNIIFNLINSFCHCTEDPGRWKTCI